jgi:protocatechuate 3,4-dioxygenase beta subunit
MNINGDGMKRLSILLVLLLTSCEINVSPTQAANPAAALTTFPLSTQSPSNASNPTSSTGQDLFELNQISLSALSCSGALSPSQTEGPYYKANTPQRNILWQTGMAGKKMLVVGYVLDTNCKPIVNAWIDFWQADANGNYDNQGYTLRGHQFTDSQGRYFLETVFPGEYPGRTEHIHVKIQPQGAAIFTTQIYFPNAPNNSADGIFDPKLLVKLEDHGSYYVAYYNFVMQN